MEVDLFKLGPYLFPTINLTLVLLQQTSSGIFSAVVALLHVLGNPFDALCSILTRDEYVRQCNLLSYAKLPDIAREMTAVMATYDQWLQDPRPQLVQALSSRSRIARTGAYQPASLLLEEEKILIRNAALQLRTCRDNGAIKAKLSVLSYILTLIGAALRMYISHEPSTQQRSGYIISVVMLFGHLPVALYLNGCLGSVTHHEQVLRIVFQLWTCLEVLRRDADVSEPLLPCPRISTAPNDEQLPATTLNAFTTRYLEQGISSGLLNCVRPIPQRNSLYCEGRGRITLLIMSTFVVSGSFVCASVVQLLATTPVKATATIVPLLGCFGIWIVNWTLSTMTSACKARNIIGCKTYSWLIISCDATLSICVLGCTLWLIGGWHSQIAPAPLSDGIIISWLILVLIDAGALRLLVFWIDDGGDNSRLVLVRSTAEAMADGDGLLV